MQAAEKLGIFIPHYCYHPALSTAGSCRLCLVEVEGAPKEAIACATPVSEGMVVYTESEKVKRAREIILEFLLLNHPLDCPVCDKAGECLLQDYSFEYGTAHSRFKEPKRIPPFKDLSPGIKLATTRCILCTRCVRFMSEIAGDPQLTVINRGARNEIAVVPGNTGLDHPLAGNVVDICPVGALLDKNFIHRTRVWHLSKAPSVCGECSAGCNISIDSYRNTVFRIIPRTNKDVNDHWICDTGRHSYKKYKKLERIMTPKIKEGSVLSDTSWDEAIEAAAEGFKEFQKMKDAVAGVIFPGATNEDAFAVMEFLRTAANSNAITGIFQKPTGEDRVFKSGFVIKGDTLPNQEGLKFIFGTAERDAESILSRIDSGEIKAAYCVHNDLSNIPERTLDILKKLKFFVVEDIVMSPAAQIADVVFPGLMYYEKNGTFVNYNRRLQLLQQAVNGPKGAKNTWEIVKLMAATFERQSHFAGWCSAGDVFLKMAKQYPELEGLSHFKLSILGKPLYEKREVEEVST
ncbi:hypothetical protein AMJ80_11645 [bacterium SM23_31]|nr:MAG: hypothetical protein AMJ80_11645 [bacterium SM23_31]